MFRSIRWRLTLWYTGVLAVALIIFAAAVYAGARHAIFQPVDNEVSARASFVEGHWIGFARQACAGQDLDTQVLWTCYAPNGAPVEASPDVTDGYSPGFVDTQLAKTAIQQGSVTASANIGRAGLVRRYFAQVRETDGTVLGAIEVGVPIGTETTALHNLLILIIIIGSVALLGAALGGVFLADRALAPARLAYARQRNFVADASHELRTPLTMLRADADVLLRSGGNLAPDQVELVRDMVAESSHMALLANHMLDLARLEAADAPIEQEVVDLRQLAESVTRRAEALAAEKGVSLRVEAPGETLVVGDPTLLDQALLVLIDNAIKYNRTNGEVQMTVRRFEDRAVVTVRDTGVGIEPRHLPHLGERFYRADASRTGEHSGAGLGIAIARTIAARHGGSLVLQSEPREGTIATLSLPAASRQ